MNARHALAAVTISLVAASPASATVLSASTQAVGTRPSRADYLQVTEVQRELNATMDDMNAAGAASGSISEAAPSTGGAGYVVQKEGPGGIRYGDIDPWTAQGNDDGLSSGRLATPIGPRGFVIPGTHDDNRRANGGRRGGGGGRHGGGPHAAPEPSTWMLLGVGLTMLGGFVTLRRRTVTER